jgi:sortase A
MLGGAALLGTYYLRQHAAKTAQRVAAEWLKENARTQQSGAKTPNLFHRRLSHGNVVDKLIIPRLHLEVIVFEGDDAGILNLGAGHIPTTALPLERGNVGIAAHRDTYFRPLRFIRTTNAIAFKTPRGTLQ